MQVLQMLKKPNTEVFRSLLFTIPARPNLIDQIYGKHALTDTHATPRMLYT